jgi:hypothetical protein
MRAKATSSTSSFSENRGIDLLGRLGSLVPQQGRTILRLGQSRPGVLRRKLERHRSWLGLGRMERPQQKKWRPQGSQLRTQRSW